MKAMILAAGIGSRLKELTKHTPKALIKIKDRPLLEIAITKLKSQGIEDIIINVHHHAGQIIDYVKTNNSFDINIQISEESDLLDTGGGLKQASWFFEDGKPFLLHNVDVLSNIDINDLLHYHNAKHAHATIAVRQRRTSRYFLFDDTDQLCGWKNESSGEQKISKETNRTLQPFSFMGIHIISPQVFTYFPQENKFSIVDFYLNIAAELKIIGFRADQFSWIDCGRPEKLVQAKNIIS